ncbi:hypothetical protein SAMN04487950_0221 [Halogranum rubrum]|uniref:Uncharacterized protein n=1 Tax=Halogranum rubrum TaxID=553466 RepID=A0A1I4B099_9EURY|nr:hypothetical protein SAMN04487950_0221 [Halogranum rubrum]
MNAAQIDSETAFRTTLREVVREAQQNGLSVQGGWVLMFDGEINDVEVEIVNIDVKRGQQPHSDITGSETER